LKQLGEHDKPVILLNTDGFYGLLNDLFEHLYRHHFAKADFRRLYYFAPSVPDVFRHLDGYKPVRFPRKWYEE
jgi:predicted Rossmann-fold nucleotide-binding protein